MKILKTFNRDNPQDNISFYHKGAEKKITVVYGIRKLNKMIKKPELAVIYMNRSADRERSLKFFNVIGERKMTCEELSDHGLVYALRKNTRMLLVFSYKWKPDTKNILPFIISWARDERRYNVDQKVLIEATKKIFRHFSIKEDPDNFILNIGDFFAENEQLKMQF